MSDEVSRLKDEVIAVAKRYDCQAVVDCSECGTIFNCNAALCQLHTALRKLDWAMAEGRETK